MTTPIEQDIVWGAQQDAECKPWEVAETPWMPEPPAWYDEEQPVVVEAIEEQELEYMLLMDWHDEDYEHGIEDDAEWIRRGGAGSPF